MICFIISWKSDQLIEMFGNNYYGSVKCKDAIFEIFLHHIKELIINIKPVVESKYTWLDFVLTINKEPYNDYLDYEIKYYENDEWKEYLIEQNFLEMHFISLFVQIHKYRPMYSPEITDKLKKVILKKLPKTSNKINLTINFD